MPVVPLHDNTDVPEPPDIVAALRVQVRPLLGEITVVRLTVPLKPFNADTVTVVEALTPEFTFTMAGLAAIVKSWKLKVAEAEWVKDPLVPVTVRVLIPAAAALQETVAVPEPVTVLGVIAPQTRPAGTVSVTVTTPEKPLMAVIVIVELADWPTMTAAGEDAVMVKSAALVNMNVAVAE